LTKQVVAWYSKTMKRVRIEKIPIEILDSKESGLSLDNKLILFVSFLFVLCCAYLLLVASKQSVPASVISPIAEEDIVPSPTPVVLCWTGVASYYSRSGCIGCSENLIMANGEALDDEKLTIAMPPSVVREHKLLNKTVTIKNVKTHTITTARVTDTGGFAVYHRIADLSVAVKRSLQCSDLCEVEITAD